MSSQAIRCTDYCTEVSYIRNSIKGNNQRIFSLFKNHWKKICNILIFNY